MENEFDHRAYTYHFYFHDGLFAFLAHIEDFINEIDNHLKFRHKSKKIVELESTDTDPIFNAEIQFGAIFPDILWRTTFLHCYFLLESSLEEICNNVQKAEKYKISVKDMQGRGIQRSALYLKKVADAIKPFETKTWNEILSFSKIRNLFVHSDGKATPDNKEIKKFESEFPGILVFDSFDKNYLTISIDKEFSLYALKVIEQFFTDISVGIRPKR